MAKMDGEVYLIGLFSICLNADEVKNGGLSEPDSPMESVRIENITRSSSKELNRTRWDTLQTNKVALWYYLNFENTVTTGNFEMVNKTTVKFGTMSFDVCTDPRLLVETALSLILDQQHHYKVTENHVYMKYIVIYSFMDARLTRLAGQLFSVLHIPYVAVSDRQETMLPRTIFPFYHQIGTQTQDASTMKRFLDHFRWKSIAIITLSADKQNLARTRDLYQLLAKNGTFCVYKKSAFDVEGIDKTIKLLRNNPSVKIVYAMGNAVDTKRFLREFARESISDRVLFVDVSSFKFLSILRKGLFLVSNFFIDNYIDYLKFRVCNNTWFHSYDTRTNSRCMRNRTELILRDLYSQETAQTMKLLKFAVTLPMMLSNDPSTPRDLQNRYSVMLLASDRTQKYFTAGFYLINIKDQHVLYPLTMVKEIDDTKITWPGNMTKSPNAQCVNYRTVPPGCYQTFGDISEGNTEWDSEVGWTYQICESGTIKPEPRIKGYCRKCPRLYRADGNRTMCFDPYTNRSVVNFETKTGVLFSSFLLLGIVLNVLYMTCFVYHRATPVVKSSQFVLTMIQLTSHLAMFIFILIGHTDNRKGFTCSILSVAIGLSFSLNLGVTLTKTQLVVAIFAMRRKISYQSKVKQKQTGWIITALSVGCSLLLSIVTISYRTPVVAFDLDHSELNRFTFCDFGEHIQFQFVYTLILSFACAVQSARARRLPELFKNTRFIIYAMFTNLITMLVFFTLFRTQRKNARRRAYVLAFSASITNALILTIVHSSRVYNIFDSRTNNTKFLRHHVQANLKKQNENYRLNVPAFELS